MQYNNMLGNYSAVFYYLVRGKTFPIECTIHKYTCLLLGFQKREEQYHSLRNTLQRVKDKRKYSGGQRRMPDL
jgi:hypothetical protein